ncbi:MAG: YfcE family phosphodiesterase [Clostridia bacterium]|nr:YfcE family phosphodiesterase [Clostridia bacterium]
MKRVIALSDSHGDAEGLRECYQMAKRSGAVDIAVFLGDGADDFEKVRPEWEAQGTVCYAVSGNNDWRSDNPQEISFRVGKVVFYACHGHTRYVKYGFERLWFAAREREAQVALYGHTHRADIEIEYGLYMINPGAVCERRPKAAAFAEIFVEDNGGIMPGIVRWD